MDTSQSEPASSPLVPEGYIYAGPASDFLPSPKTNANENQSKEMTSSGTGAEAEPVPAPACPSKSDTAGHECEHKGSKDADEYLIKVVEIPQPAGRYPPKKRIAISYFHNKWYAFLNICPHQGSALSRGSMMDIEDMGIVWGAGVTCSLHNWTFDAQSGQSDATRFVIDTFDVKEIEGHVFVSQAPRNAHVAGPRRDFGGREMN